jgi:hypothetical protein
MWLQSLLRQGRGLEMQIKSATSETGSKARRGPLLSRIFDCVQAVLDLLDRMNSLIEAETVAE